MGYSGADMMMSRRKKDFMEPNPNPGGFRTDVSAKCKYEQMTKNALDSRKQLFKFFLVLIV